MGFGQAARQHAAPALARRALARVGRRWSTMIAEGLGVELDEIREVHERAARARDLRHRGRHASRRAPPRRCASRCRASSTAEPAHRRRARHPAARRPRARLAAAGRAQGCYRILVEGSPSLKCELELGEDGDHNTGGLVGDGDAAAQRHPRGVRRRRPACSRRSTCPWSPAIVGDAEDLDTWWSRRATNAFVTSRCPYDARPTDHHAPVAQWTERRTSIPLDGGSNPPGRATLSRPGPLPRSGTIRGPLVAVAQLVRAPGCGPGGRGFESPRSPHFVGA